MCMISAVAIRNSSHDNILSITNISSKAAVCGLGQMNGFRAYVISIGTYMALWRLSSMIPYLVAVLRAWLSFMQPL